MAQKGEAYCGGAVSYIEGYQTRNRNINQILKCTLREREKEN